MNKYIRDGKVAVLYSPGYGIGWYSCNREAGKQILFDPELAQVVLDKGDYLSLIKNKYPNIYFEDILQVEWVNEGSAIEIGVYDGNEFIEYLHLPHDVIIV